MPPTKKQVPKKKVPKKVTKAVLKKVCKDRLVKKKGVPIYFYYDCKKYKLKMEGNDKLDDKELIAYLIRNIKIGKLKAESTSKQPKLVSTSVGTVVPTNSLEKQPKTTTKSNTKKVEAPKKKVVQPEGHQADLVVGKPLKAELTAKEKLALQKDALNTAYFLNPLRGLTYPGVDQAKLPFKLTGNPQEDIKKLIEEYNQKKKKDIDRKFILIGNAINAVTLKYLTSTYNEENQVDDDLVEFLRDISDQNNKAIPRMVRNDAKTFLADADLAQLTNRDAIQFISSKKNLLKHIFFYDDVISPEIRKEIIDDEDVFDGINEDMVKMYGNWLSTNFTGRPKPSQMFENVPEDVRAPNDEWLDTLEEEQAVENFQVFIALGR